MAGSTKERILSILKENQGNRVSGQFLSLELGISRTAVWKQVKVLRAEGYSIESSPRKGYLLLETPALLLPAEIRVGLATECFGRGKIVYFEEVDSTNTVGKDLAGRGAEEGTVVAAEGQRNGRGRRGREWYSPAGHGLYASFILRPALSPSEAPMINIVAAVAAAEALMDLTGIQAKVKWPNDILAGSKKLAGILTEMSADLDGVDYVVVGLGVNVLTGEFPAELAETATSILLETGRAVSRIEILQTFLNRFETLYRQFQRNGRPMILNRYRELCGFIGRPVTVDTVNSRLSGTVLGVDDEGRLLLREDHGGSRHIFSGDIVKVR